MKSLLYVALVASVLAFSTADVPLKEPDAVTKELVVEAELKSIEEPASARDYKEPAAPSYPPTETSDGYYYYYYPVEEKQGGVKEKEEFSKLETIIVTGIVIIIVLLALQLLPNLLPLVNLLGALAGGLPLIPINGRAFDYARAAFTSTLESISTERMGELTVLVIGALEEEQCFRRLVCESGKMAKGRETWIDLAKVVMPGKYSEHMRIMKESALNKNDCKSYKCGPLPLKKQ